MIAMARRSKGKLKQKSKEITQQLSIRCKNENTTKMYLIQA